MGDERVRGKFSGGTYCCKLYMPCAEVNPAGTEKGSCWVCGNGWREGSGGLIGQVDPEVDD